MLGHGSSSYDESADLIEALSRGWPHLVLRVGATPVPVPTVLVAALYRGPLRPAATGPAVYQALSRLDRAPGPGILLPPLRRSQVATMVEGRVEARWRWVRAWRKVWDTAWG